MGDFVQIRDDKNKRSEVFNTKNIKSANCDKDMCQIKFSIFFKTCYKNDKTNCYHDIHRFVNTIRTVGESDKEWEERKNRYNLQFGTYR